MTKLIVDGTKFDVPDEDDWELGELAEFARLKDKWGDLGSTIALVWIVKHRADPAFTIEQAERVKVGQLEEIEEAEVPLDSSDGNSATNSNSPVPSEIPDDSGLLLSAGSTV